MKKIIIPSAFAIGLTLYAILIFEFSRKTPSNEPIDTITVIETTVVYECTDTISLLLKKQRMIWEKRDSLGYEWHKIDKWLAGTR